MKSKRMPLFVMVCFCMLLLTGTTVFAESSAKAVALKQAHVAAGEPDVLQMQVQVVVDGVMHTLQDPAVNLDGRTFLPIRAFQYLIGADIEWDDINNIGAIIYGGRKVETFSGSNQIIVGGETVLPIDEANANVAAFIYVENGRMYLPLRAICDNLGLVVSWDGTNQIIYITTPPQGSGEGEVQVVEAAALEPVIPYSKKAIQPAVDGAYIIKNRGEMEKKLKEILNRKDYAVQVDSMLVRVFDKVYTNYDAFSQGIYHKIDKHTYISELLQQLDKNATSIRIIGKEDAEAAYFDVNNVGLTQFYYSGDNHILLSKAFVDGDRDVFIFGALPTVLHELIHVGNFQRSLETELFPVDVVYMYSEGQATIYEAIIEEAVEGVFEYRPLVLWEDESAGAGPKDMLVINRMASSGAKNNYEIHAAMYMLVELLVSEHEMTAMLADGWYIEDLRYIIDERYGEGVYDTIFPHIYAISLANNYEYDSLKYEDRQLHTKGLNQLKERLRTESDPYMSEALQLKIAGVELNMDFNERMFQYANGYTGLRGECEELYEMVIQQIIIPKIEAINSREAYAETYYFVEGFRNILPRWLSVTPIGTEKYEIAEDKTESLYPSFSRMQELLAEKAALFNR